MPHSKHSVPTARNLSSRSSSTAPSGRLPTTPKPAYQSTGQRRKANSAPPVLVNGRVYTRYGARDADRTTGFNHFSTGAVVKTQTVTSRPGSPSSSFSATDTLAHFSDTSSVTATEATSPTASPKSTSASVASRRYKFKEEFGTEDAIGASAIVHGKQAEHAACANQHTKHAGVVDAVHDHYSIVPSHSHERTAVHAVKKTKTKAHKKTSRSCAPNLDFAYRNVYTAATGIGNATAPSASGKGKGVRDVFEGPNLATAQVGCVVM